MGKEVRRKQQSPGEPPVREDPETSFPAQVRMAVDTLFTYRAIRENLQGREADEDANIFVRTWKQKLVQHLEETAELAVVTFLADLELFDTERTSTFSLTTNPKRDVARRVK